MPSRPDPTAARRMRELYARKRDGIEWQPLTCSNCGGPHLNRHDGICSRCWESITQEGRDAKAQRVRKSRAKKRKRDSL
jgi:hypothetical protein